MITVFPFLISHVTHQYSCNDVKGIYQQQSCCNSLTPDDPLFADCPASDITESVKTKILRSTAFAAAVTQDREISEAAFGSEVTFSPLEQDVTLRANDIKGSVIRHNNTEYILSSYHAISQPKVERPHHDMYYENLVPEAILDDGTIMMSLQADNQLGDLDLTKEDYGYPTPMGVFSDVNTFLTTTLDGGKQKKRYFGFQGTKTGTAVIEFGDENRNFDVKSIDYLFRSYVTGISGGSAQSDPKLYDVQTFEIKHTTGDDAVKILNAMPRDAILKLQVQRGSHTYDVNVKVLNSATNHANTTHVKVKCSTELYSGDSIVSAQPAWPAVSLTFAGTTFESVTRKTILYDLTETGSGSIEVYDLAPLYELDPCVDLNGVYGSYTCEFAASLTPSACDPASTHYAETFPKCQKTCGGCTPQCVDLNGVYGSYTCEFAESVGGCDPTSTHYAETFPKCPVTCDGCPKPRVKHIRSIKGKVDGTAANGDKLVNGSAPVYPTTDAGGTRVTVAGDQHGAHNMFVAEDQDVLYVIATYTGGCSSYCASFISYDIDADPSDPVQVGYYPADTYGINHDQTVFGLTRAEQNGLGIPVDLQIDEMYVMMACNYGKNYFGLMNATDPGNARFISNQMPVAGVGVYHQADITSDKRCFIIAEETVPDTREHVGHQWMACMYWNTGDNTNIAGAYVTGGGQFPSSGSGYLELRVVQDWHVPTATAMHNQIIVPNRDVFSLHSEFEDWIVGADYTSGVHMHSLRYAPTDRADYGSDKEYYLRRNPFIVEQVGTIRPYRGMQMSAIPRVGFYGSWGCFSFADTGVRAQDRFYFTTSGEQSVLFSYKQGFRNLVPTASHNDGTVQLLGGMSAEAEQMEREHSRIAPSKATQMFQMMTQSDGKFFPSTWSVATNGSWEDVQSIGDVRYSPVHDMVYQGLNGPHDALSVSAHDVKVGDALFASCGNGVQKVQVLDVASSVYHRYNKGNRLKGESIIATRGYRQNEIVASGSTCTIGDSGAPVADANGDIVGIVSSKDVVGGNIGIRPIAPMLTALHPPAVSIYDSPMAGMGCLHNERLAGSEPDINKVYASLCNPRTGEIYGFTSGNGNYYWAADLYHLSAVPPSISGKSGIIAERTKLFFEQKDSDEYIVLDVWGVDEDFSRAMHDVDIQVISGDPSTVKIGERFEGETKVDGMYFSPQMAFIEAPNVTSKWVVHEVARANVLSAEGQAFDENWRGRTWNAPPDAGDELVGTESGVRVKVLTRPARNCGATCKHPLLRDLLIPSMNEVLHPANPARNKYSPTSFDQGDNLMKNVKFVWDKKLVRPLQHCGLGIAMRGVTPINGKMHILAGDKAIASVSGVSVTSDTTAYEIAKHGVGDTVTIGYADGSSEAFTCKRWFENTYGII